MPELQHRIGLSRSHIYSMMADGIFPRQINLGPRAVGWLEIEIDAWLEQRIKERRLSNGL